MVVVICGLYLFNFELAANDTPSVYLTFNKVSYQTNEDIVLEVHAENFNDLFGFQIDIEEVFGDYSFLADTEPYELGENNVFGNEDRIWVNTVDGNIATFMVSKPLETELGYDYSEDSLLGIIRLKALKSIDNIYDVFEMSDTLSDLTYGNANIVVKLSDHLGDPIAYDYVMMNYDVPEVRLKAGLDTIYIGHTHSDQGIEVVYEGAYQLSVDSNVNINSAGDYEIVYTVNYAGGSVEITRYVHVLATMPIVLFELNDAITTLIIGQTFVETGCQAFVGDQSYDCIVIENNVDEDTIGTYYIIYQVTIHGLEYQTKRMIRVVDKPENMRHLGGVSL